MYNISYDMDFSMTDALFEGDNEGYVDFLQVSIEEFETDFPKLKQALQNSDPELFSAVKHKFSSRLDAFGLDTLHEFMSEISSNYKKDVDSVDVAMATAELERHLVGILETLKAKKAELA